METPICSQTALKSGPVQLCSSTDLKPFTCIAPSAKEREGSGITFSGEIRLCPDDYVSNSASATECTGLMQVTTDDEDVQEAYDAVYSFRAKPEKDDKI